MTLKKELILFFILHLVCILVAVGAAAYHFQWWKLISIAITTLIAIFFYIRHHKILWSSQHG